ncbi:MAG: right-handed parallel beta-helix repeat-containing protein [Acaryochloridaceae cyanobacterium RL_2_7]|nr:right-handed parallel beta-helix repeat-containing protein [Acaryochloridaceae cyanobacterium RL_2_7]
MITNSTISGNEAQEGGGGINIEDESDVSIINSTIYGNTAQEAGGGISSDPSDTGVQLSISNSIISGNTAPQGSEFSIDDDEGSSNISGGFNVVGQNGNSGGFPAIATDIIPSGSTDTVLDPVLRDNGGPTQTHALVEGSPAIDAAADAGLLTDQRGVTRPQNQTPDIGAFEVEQFLNPPTSRLIFTPDGDGGVRVTVDAFGAFGSSVTGNAVYDPVGEIGPAGTTFESGVAFRLTEETFRFFLTAFEIGGSGGLEGSEFLSSTDTNATSRFQIGSLTFELDQTVVENFQDGQRSGSTLSQSYTITNTSSLPVEFELIRYFDGDLDFDGSLRDGGGSLIRDGQQILFETDGAGLPETSTTFIGLSSIGGSPIAENRFEAAAFDGLRSRILQGDVLRNQIEGDGNDADSFVDAGQDYDITLALRNLFSLNAGQSTSYLTSLFFGSGAPEDFVIPNPGTGETPPAAMTPNEMPPNLPQVPTMQPSNPLARFASRPLFEEHRLDQDITFEGSGSPVPQSGTNLVPPNPLTPTTLAAADASIGDLENAFTHALERHFNTTSANAISPELVEQKLRAADQIQDVNPALLYAYFAESTPAIAEAETKAKTKTLVASTDLTLISQTPTDSETTNSETLNSETLNTENGESETLNTISADAQCLSQQSSNPNDPLWQF